ncbi:MAG TPA: DUF6279 family lipoprotein [Limnobacter sp.]|nr:DUF6279 family lipoprotein [Limnobacter sp.]
MTFSKPGKPTSTAHAPMRWMQHLALGLCVLVLAACSAIKLGYNNAASLAHGYLMSSIEWDDAQSRQVRAGLDRIVAWHRQNELPVLAAQLEQAERRLVSTHQTAGTITVADLEVHYKAIEASLARTANTAAPEIANLMLGLRQDQIQQIEFAFQQSNKAYREERLPNSRAKRLEASAERMEKRFERWLGSLDRAQRDRIVRWAEESLQYSELRYQRRLEQQAEFIRLAKLAASQQIDETSLSLRIANLLNSWQNPTTAQARLHAKDRLNATLQLVADVLNMASLQQRQRAATRSAAWSDDLSMLAKTP